MEDMERAGKTEGEREREKGVIEEEINRKERLQREGWGEGSNDGGRNRKSLE